MITIRQNTAWGLRGVSRILLLCVIHASYAVAVEPRPAKVAIAEGRNTRFAPLTTKAGLRGDRQGRVGSSPRRFEDVQARGGHALVRDLKFTHLTTSDGLSQSNVKRILQDRRGFMWFATRDGLNRYDGNVFVVYKNNPNDHGSLSANYVDDLIEDNQGDLWIATHTGGVNKFDPTTERFTRYRHDPNNPNTISGNRVESIARDSRGDLWFGTQDSGLDKLDPTTGTFTHYRNDRDGQFVGRITNIMEDSHRDIWFVGERGLFHLNPQTGQITRPPASIKGLAADYVCEDNVGNFWMLAWSPIVGLVKYNRQAERFTKYPVDAGATGLANSKLLDDGGNGFWVPSSLGLYYFDRRAEQFTRLFQHVESNPDSLNDNAVVSVYQDRGGLLWVGTENGGLNLLNLRQEQFGGYRHRPGDPDSLSAGTVTAIYEDSNDSFWVGFFPRALDSLDRKTGKITHYLPDPESKNALGIGSDLNSIYQDARGYLWLGGWASCLVRFDERTGRFKHYWPNADNPHSLLSDSILSIDGDRTGTLWVGQFGGFSRYDPAADRFTNYRPNPNDSARLAYTVSAIHRDRSGTLWLGTWGGMLSRFDDKTKTFVNYTPDSRDPHKLQGGDITAIHEDRAGTLWVGAWDGLYRYNRQNATFTHYTENQGLPSSTIEGILEDRIGMLWLSTKKGISRFDPQTETFRNYDVFDGLQGDEFSDRCYAQGPDGEIVFGGGNGFNAFFPENVRDNPYVPPVVITNFKIFNKSVPIGPKSVLKKAIPYVDSLTLPYRDNVFSLEFAALSYANSFKNRYRYKLEHFEPGWNEVDSKQRLATYTNLDPGKYVFRVQGSNSDGIWNEEGVSLPILITPPWWRTNWFRALCAAIFLALVWAAYQFRVRQLQRESKQLREVIDTIPGSVWSARPDGSLDFINRRWLEFSGVSLEKVLGQGWEAAVHPDDLARLVDEWRAALACGKALESEARIRTADGQYRWLLIRSVPLHDERGKIVKWYGTNTDIDDRKRAEEQLRKLSRAVEQSPGSVVITDRGGNIEYVNPKFVQLTGYTLEEALGKNPRILKSGEHRAEMYEQLWRTILSGGEWRGEFHNKKKNGELFWESVAISPIRNAEGAITHFLAVKEDITERKRAEEALGRSNRELRAISNCNLTLLHATDEPSLLQEICRIVCEEAGYRVAWVGYAEHDEAQSVRPAAWTGTEEGYLANLGITWADTQHGWGPTGTAIRSGKSCFIQDFATDPRMATWRESAVLRDFRSGIALPLKDEHGDAFGSLTIYSEQPSAFTPEEIRLLEELAADLAFGIVTLRSRAARQQAEEALREGETRFRTFVDHAADALFIYDFEPGTIVDVNRQACESLGYTRQELIGTTAVAFHLDSDRAQMESVAQRAAAGESVFDTHWHRRKDGTLFPVEVHTSQYWYRGRRFLLKVARDISDRLRAEEARAYLASIVESSDDAIIGRSMEGIIQSWNRGAERLYGYTAQEAIGQPITLVIPPDRAQEFVSTDRLKRGEPIEEIETVRVGKDGRRIDMSVIISPMKDDAGRVVGAATIARDITDRKRAEEALRRSEAYLAEGQRLSHTGSWAWSPVTARRNYWSEEMFRIFGFEPKQGPPALERFLQRIHPEDYDRATKGWEKTVRSKASLAEDWRTVLPDGTVRNIHLIGHPVLDEARELVEYVGTAMDVTEQKRAEEQRDRLRQLETELAHLDRVSMLGELAASIAHEVNQPLSGIVSNGSACLRFLARDIPNVEEAREAARDIVRDGKRAGEVIARIRALTKKAATPREELDLNDTLREVLALVGDEAKKRKVLIRTQFAHDLSPISGDRVQLQQVVLNLVMNGIEAMSSIVERARELVITTRKIEPDQVQVTVEDSGIGIDPQALDKIFDSFYTTKPGGMGMGLSISRSIVQNHGGRLWATVNDGPGTSFHFTLPQYHDEESKAGV
jgi:PAS domain S-box-containing protein